MILKVIGKPFSLLRHVKDRDGHDRRYALNCDKITRLGWRPRHSVNEALESTVFWYRDHPEWWRKIKTGEFRTYYERMYGARLSGPV